MTLYLIGIGLNDAKDITLKGLELVKKADVVYLESYTSKLNTKVDELEKLYGKKITIANRKAIEIDSDTILLKQAKSKGVALLIVGDVFCATTHSDLFLRARKLKISITVVHNASVLTAIGITGLQLYKFGKVASIPYANENVEVPYDALKQNQSNNLHTLFLLDLTEEGTNSLPIPDAIRYLLKVEMKRGEQVFTEKTICVGCAKLGSKDQIIKYGSAKELLKHDFKDGMQCLIVPSKKLHFMEEDVLALYR